MIKGSKHCNKKGGKKTVLCVNSIFPSQLFLLLYFLNKGNLSDPKTLFLHSAFSTTLFIPPLQLHHRRRTTATFLPTVPLVNIGSLAPACPGTEAALGSHQCLSSAPTACSQQFLFPPCTWWNFRTLENFAYLNSFSSPEINDSISPWMKKDFSHPASISSSSGPLNVCFV